jgi:hypothetical protein
MNVRFKLESRGFSTIRENTSAICAVLVENVRLKLQTRRAVMGEPLSHLSVTAIESRSLHHSKVSPLNTLLTSLIT